MKISGINNQYNQNFKGLWGKTYLKTDIDCVWGTPNRIEERYYYPFSNEDREDVKKNFAKMSSAKFTNNLGRHLYREYIVAETLPFDEQQYEAYMSVGNDYRTDRSLSDRDKWVEHIHSWVKDKYISPEYGRNQIPAYNLRVEEHNMDSFI